MQNESNSLANNKKRSNNKLLLKIKLFEQPNYVCNAFGNRLF